MHVTGTVILDRNFKEVETLKFSSPGEFRFKEKIEKQLRQKYPDLEELPVERKEKMLEKFRDKKFFPDFYLHNSALTRLAIKQSVSQDVLIIQAIANIQELDKAANLLVKRLREWYGWYFPEFAFRMTDNEKFTELVVSKKREELQKEIHLKETMGADLDKTQVEEILLLARQVQELYQLRKKHEDYLHQTMKTHCPNILELAGVTIGARLLELGKGLKHIALLPSSTIQLLGAEKALFRHLKTGARSPKYGVIINHPFVQKAKREDKGKMARKLADKLSLCARLDYFKGEFKALDYRRELEGELEKS